ncbi:hypothetical protein [Streptomyces sp. NPDC049040]|uniref:hypothetical protein n=1 Tax=Streptomyces sp. NPDC049040 TaxID=3365593 RepID=UPI003715794B
MFRWITALGLVLMAGGIGFYWADPQNAPSKQVELTVLQEDADGTCTVQWHDPVSGHDRKGPFHCDADRDSLLKVPQGAGWDTGFVVTSGPYKDRLYSADDETWQTNASDVLISVSVLALSVGVIGGSIRAVTRLSGVRPETVRRARRLREAAALAAQDHQRAVEAVRAAAQAWGSGGIGALTADGERTDPQTAALLTAVQILVNAGPQATYVAAAGQELAARLDGLLAEAEPTEGWRQMLDAGTEERNRARVAIGKLHAVVEEAEARGLPEQFAQTSVDLLRTPGDGPGALPAWLDYEARPAEYRNVLTSLVSPALAPPRESA